MRSPLDAAAESVPVVGSPGELTLVDGRTFVISELSGNCTGGTHGLIYDDLRHLSYLRVAVGGASLHTLAATAPTPLSSVSVQRLHDADDVATRCLMVRRRWIARGLRDEIELVETGHAPRSLRVTLSVAADFAHLFDVKAARGGGACALRQVDGHWALERTERSGPRAATRLAFSIPPHEVDVASGTFAWSVEVTAGAPVRLTVTVEPVVDGSPAGLAFPIGTAPADALPLVRHREWRAAAPTLESTEPRLVTAVNQTFADLSALRIVDRSHPERVVVAAGAPWFMTLFGRDSLLTSWMTLPFDSSLAAGTLRELGELRGRGDDPAADEQPGKILHELRRPGGGGAFTERQRYFGSVDATPLFVGLTAEAWRWGALDADDLHELAPSVRDALSWIILYGDSDGDGFVDYRRRGPSGLTNQGWKDSWDGVTFANGMLSVPPIGLIEVQGYVYDALLGAAELIESAGVDTLGFDAADLRARAQQLRGRCNEVLWDERGWYALGVDGFGRPIDSLTSNPGHALWKGIAEPELADRYLDRVCDAGLWSGWGVRTLADTMAAYDPLSYHNGSVWPHDTAICAAGAARYGRFEVVDTIVEGMLAAVEHFGGRPPELFAGISRDEVPVPVPYPSSCSPQAWSSASILLLVRALLGIEPTRDGIELRRDDLDGLPWLRISGLCSRAGRLDLEVDDGVAVQRRAGHPSSAGASSEVQKSTNPR